MLRHLEQAFDLNRRIGGNANADGYADMRAIVAEHLDHQVGGAIHHLRSFGEAGGRIDEAAEPDDPRDLVEFAEGRLDLREGR